MKHLLLISLLFLTSCATQTTAPTPEAKDEKNIQLKPVSFNDLPGWGQDNLLAFAPAFQKTCARIAKKDANQSVGTLPQAGTYKDWQIACADFSQHQGTAGMKSFFETKFTPYQVTASGNPDGLFTGYYEAALHGSKTKQGKYNIPLYTRPHDLIMVDLGNFREELKGQRIAGRVIDGNLKPYETREQIVTGSWPHNDKVLVWVDDAVDAFFVQVQGSGIIQMDDSSIIRIGYAGQNGHPYYAIGRELVARGVMPKEEVSMQSIRTWLEANPTQADELMNTNKSYVFFSETKEEGPKGGEGIALTPERSLAIDHSLLPYGIPVWLATEQPAMQKLMMAQDTGGAIRGAVRGDVFWGYGERAEEMAGMMKSPGQYWILLPKSATP